MIYYFLSILESIPHVPNLLKIKPSIVNNIIGTDILAHVSCLNTLLAMNMLNLHGHCLTHLLDLISLMQELIQTKMTNDTSNFRNNC